MQNETIHSAWARGGNITIRRLPIEAVLNKVPGNSTTEKADKIGVSRVIVWSWITGRKRPSWRSCQTLEKITGVPAMDIFGRVLRRRRREG